jgi:hypothetical protein
MLIESINALFDELMLSPKQRRASARFVIRSFCKIQTAAALKSLLLRSVFPSRTDKETMSLLYAWQKRQQASIEYSVMLWRGIFCFVDTGSCERASAVSGFSSTDIRYAVGCLEVSDVREIKKCDKLNWRRAPISMRARTKILAGAMPAIRRNARKLKFTEDAATTPHDIEQQLVIEALAVIAHYECTRRGDHLLATVVQSLNNAQRDLCDSFTAQKRCAKPSRLELLDAKTGAKEWKHEHLMEPIMLVADDSSESENPALLSRCVTIDSEIEVRNIVDVVRKQVPRYGRYLGITVLPDRRNKKFHRWLRKHQKRITTDALLDSCARTFCRVTDEDINAGRKIVAEAFGVSLPEYRV